MFLLQSTLIFELHCGQFTSGNKILDWEVFEAERLDCSLDSGEIN
ncbi:MAG TPA: hypothetical protein VLR54_02305 [Methanobacteriaceae archaeon]|nr:hypothetical protein [Methanobacteriaceae archaeon]